MATLGEVNRLASAVERLGTSLKSLNKEFSAFVQEDRLARNMQFAQTALIDVRAERDRQFGHYAAVRRGTVGMLQAMDAGIVTESALQQAAERLMIDTPGYWLAPAQVALAAWISNSQELANRALREAMYREPNKTALFFSLVLARHERYGATAKWMHEYAAQQNPLSLSREFTVVLDAAAQGALGGRALELVKERCVTWYERLRSAEDIVQEQSLRWQRWMSRNRREIAGQFKVLPRMCPDWTGVALWLESATVHGETERWLRKQLETTVVSQEGLRPRVDGVLRNLVTAYDQDEDFLRKQEMKWAEVISHNGNHALAAQAEEVNAADESSADFLGLLTTIALTPDKAGASVTTRQLAIRLANEWISTAAHKLSIKSHAENPASIDIQIREWRGKLSSHDNLDDAIRSYTRFVDKEVHDEIGRVTINGPVGVFSTILTVLVGSLIALAFRILAVTFELSAGSVMFILLILSFIWLRRAQRVLPQRREEVHDQGEDRKRAGIADLVAAFDEVRKVFHLWRAELAKESSLVNFVHEESARTDPLEMPGIENSEPVSEPAHPIFTETDRLPELSAGAGDHPGDDQSFAFRLPQWDLLPPARRIDGS